MGRRDELIELYAHDLREKCRVTPDMELLRKVTIGCGPTIYSDDSCLVAGSDATERATIRRNFLVRKLGLADAPHLDDAIDAVIETYGRSEPRKYRAVVYYLLVRHFGRDSVYG